ncbi:FtsH protease activity modulator HflK [Ancylobacter defluvii]|uniref:Protein HflK n=1 Tax=Ancylobacter defluvii TaxID=1282440 RepID=A0A9W6JR58_9HYPH|nr:FtsH protease activity modulator HflK [Ancylobacter defluvii]MBS7587541.1 FtsH protease activity modulator HflK [Ancylobacter defluvii]GLK82231.1 protease modulator HflK [Ancylobacter defluvii]
MPWKNQSGGPWGGGPRGPWGSGPQSPGPNSPDLEDLIRRGQEKLRTVVPGGFGSGKGILAIVAIAVIVWLLSGFYRVEPDEQGVVLRFGKFVSTSNPGLNYHLPYPIETVLTPQVTRVNRIDIGIRSGDDPRRGAAMRDVPEESLMLTGDENIVDVDFAVFWMVKPAAPGSTEDIGAANFLFNVQNPEGTIKAVAESAMREVVGRTNIQPILTGARQNIETAVHDLMQRTLDEYQSGVLVTQVQLQKVDPPQQVIDSFRDVQAARADAERLQNEAQAYANRVVPEARGESARITQGAQGYKERAIIEARGQASRFLSVLTEYQKAPDVTRQRLYLETMERIFAGMDKVILDTQTNGAGGQGVVPYLPLSALEPRPTTPAAQGAAK